jgi:hypothetical protein
MGFVKVCVGNSSRDVRNDKLSTLGNQIEENAMSVIYGKKHKFLYGFFRGYTWKEWATKWNN